MSMQYEKPASLLEEWQKMEMLHHLVEVAENAGEVGAEQAREIHKFIEGSKS